jgi:peptidoglycan/xylan/chitin deacetylase (PgdA/CDA1 family)
MRRLARKALAVALLPASVVPVALAAPQIVASYHRWERKHESGPLAVAATKLTAAERSMPRMPAHPGAVPVLAYRAVGSGAGSVSAVQLGHQLALLRRLGYRSLSAEEYARFQSGVGGLPERPVLITFDRGLLASYRKADSLLARTGMRATIFVETARVQAEDPKHLHWSELKAMEASSRWDVQTYGHEADRPVTIDRYGRSAPFYAARRYTRGSGLETLADFEQRAALDLFESKRLLRAHGFEPLLFALPDRDYSSTTSNDQRALPLVATLVRRQFAAAFSSTDRAPEFSQRGRPAARLLVDRALGSRGLYRWLHAHNPGLERRPRGN